MCLESARFRFCKSAQEQNVLRLLVLKAYLHYYERLSPFEFLRIACMRRGVTRQRYAVVLLTAACRTDVEGQMIGMSLVN
jgi:hypothetical protein